MKRLFWMFLLTLSTVIVSAQNPVITTPVAPAATASQPKTLLLSGEITDKDNKEPIEQATVQLLLAKDSSYVDGALTNEKGLFGINIVKPGDYLLKITSVGYKPVFRHIHMAEGHDLAMGNIALHADAIMLKGAVVTAQAQKVVLKEDTFVYNSSAFRTPEGSTIEELVKRLPGATVSDDGTITINGKTVKKILVDGKEFMTGDTKTALKNLPTSIIDKIKAYDEKSDEAKVTGIDDGEEQTVLDFGVKKGMNKGMFSNLDLGIGTQNRYSWRGMGAYFNDKNRFMIFTNANNVNDKGFPGGGGRGFFGAGRQGLQATKMIGGNYNFTNGKKLNLNLSLRWNHSDGDLLTTTAAENFVSTTGSFSNSRRQNFSRSDSWDGRFWGEWKADSLTDVMTRGSVSWGTTDGLTDSHSASFNEDPYKYVKDALDKNSIQELAEKAVAVNEQENDDISYSKSNSAEAMVQLSRRLSRKGRNLTVRVNGNYGKTTARDLQLNNTYLYLVKTALGEDSTYMTNRYNYTPTTNYGYGFRVMYSEPLWKATFLQLSYRFNYKYSKSDRATYDFSDIAAGTFDGLNTAYRSWDSYINRLTSPLSDYLDNDLSRYSEYRNYIHNIRLVLRFVRSKWNLNVGVEMTPQRSKYMQDYQGIHVDTVRTVTNWSPMFDFRYRFSKVSNLRINYKGSTDQPSISQLLDITDDSDPLNITKGNPGLKPSYTQNLRLFYNTYVQRHQRAVMTFLNFSTTSNAISNRVSYDETTGGRTTMPENINGNWNVNGAFMFNTAIDTAGVWNINSFTNVNYNHYVSYLALNSKSSSQKNTTKTTTIGEKLDFSYRNDWLEIGVNGSFDYTHADNKLQQASNLSTWQFSYGPTATVTLPWGMSISTDLSENSRRGYSDASMNTNELVWNAQIAQSMLKGKALTFSLQFYDILHNQSNISRTISALQRSDVEYNSINSYIMLHAIYRFNLFGGKQARRQGPGDGPRPDFSRPEFRRGGMGGPGGGPGGRPMF
ncbi:TonB-dependent receptor [Prevotella sp. AGR2160]|uniref:TonB-dependent receptor n=1 Tax=Prevotella sp. AGR2160 TaxID=1280674 RepID=UPI0004070D5C|nr:TonB-dependent receptor [Prevotella sp. AGR2160]